MEAGPEARVPDFDPWDGGTDAEVLYLLEAPGGKAVESGFISRNNPDETARNFFELNRAAGIPRQRTVIRIFLSPHPSPLFVNNAPGNRERILGILREVACYLELRAPDV
ncbi:MAG: hypothetical protein ACREON_01305 [Gemmatimonadaceae bacterium]